MAIIPVGENHHAIVDDRDYELVAANRWHAVVGAYATYAGRPFTGSSNGEHRLMHRLILDAPADRQVDHIDHDGLNNRRDNLRLCTHAENMQNRRVHKVKTSRFKGVSWDSWHGKWRASLHGRFIPGHKLYRLGAYESETAAALAYDFVAIRVHGDFANCNLPYVA